MRNDLSHLTLDGEPLCENSCMAYWERLRAAGSPPCSDTTQKQLPRYEALAAQFPGRVALVHGGCPKDRLEESDRG